MTSHDRIESILQKFNVRQACDPVPKCEAIYFWEFGKNNTALHHIVPICHSKVLDQWDKQVWIGKGTFEDNFLYSERTVIDNLLRPFKKALNVEELKKKSYW